MEKEIAKLRDGVGTPYYAAVIKSIRDFLENVEQIDQSKGGAIIFFQKIAEQGNDDDLIMQVFPFKPKGILTQDDCGLAMSEIAEVLRKINNPKPYRLFWHHKQFKEHCGTDGHFSSTVPLENILTYDKDGITYSVEEKKTSSVSNTPKQQQQQKKKKKGTWKTFFQDLEDGLVDKNTFEQLLFESGCKGVSFIPIPVLSTPSILLVLNQKYLDGNKAGVLRSLYFRSRDTVDSYLYSRLLDSLVDFLEVAGKTCTEHDLVEAFVKEICNVILPVSYRINAGNPVEYYKDWPTDGINSSYNLKLLKGKWNIEFTLTSFHYVDLDDPHGINYNWIHQSKVYEANMEQSAILLCKLFKLMHKNWELLQSAERRAHEEISKAIAGIDVEGLQQKVKEVANKFEAIRCKVESPQTINRLVVEDECIKLSVDGEEIVSFVRKSNTNQFYGFSYLYEILYEASSSNYQYEVSVENLAKNIVLSGKSSISTSAKNKKESAIRDIQQSLDAIFEMLLAFSETYHKKITAIISSGQPEKDTSFNDTFYHCAGVYTNFKGSGFKYQDFLPSSYSSNSEEEEGPYRELYEQRKTRARFMHIYNEIGALLKVYNTADKSKTAKMLEKFRKNEDLDTIAKARKVLITNENALQLREYFKAMIKLLRSNLVKASGRKKEALEKLLRNLEEAGLVQRNSDDAISKGGKYSYCQRGKEAFIEWEFETSLRNKETR